MYDEALLLEKLEQINDALAKIKRRFANIDSPDDFGSLVIRVTQPDKSCIQRVPLEVKIYALEQMFDV